MSFERIAPEQYDTLADVPEPREHGVLFGHRAEADELARAYQRGKLHHAIMLAGPSGIGKATLAFRLANHLLVHPDAASAPGEMISPAAGSTTFRLIAQGAHPSLLHLTRPVVDRGTGFKSAITVDEVRRVGRFLSMTSHDGGCRVVIVDAADDLNRNAANALLKSLEEPPPRTVFVLIVHSPGRLLPTIRSRCQMHPLKPLQSDDLVSALQAVAPQALSGQSAEAALIERSAGSVREALLLTAYGGLDIATAIDGIASRADFDVADAYRVAEAVSARDGTVQFQIFNGYVLDLIGREATSAARNGYLDRADALSRLWQSARDAARETETYNLDKKQHVVHVLRQLSVHGVGA